MALKFVNQFWNRYDFQNNKSMVCVWLAKGRHKSSIQQCLTSKTRTNLPKKSPSQAPTPPPLIHTATFNGQKLLCAELLDAAWNYSRTNLYDIGHFLFMAALEYIDVLTQYRITGQSSFLVCHTACRLCWNLHYWRQIFCPKKCVSYVLVFLLFVSAVQNSLDINYLYVSTHAVYMLFSDTFQILVRYVPWLYIILKLRFSCRYMVIKNSLAWDARDDSAHLVQ